MDVIFQETPEVRFASIAFVNCPIILLYNMTPLIEVGQFVDAGFTTRFSVYNKDGVAMAKVVGSRIFPTDEGKNAKLETRHESGLVVCELDGQPIMELRKTGAAAIGAFAELYSPEGVLVKVRDSGLSGMLRNGSPLQFGPVTLSGGTVSDKDIGLYLSRDDTMTLMKFGVMRSELGSPIRE
jgi:hypothetical protein